MFLAFLIRSNINERKAAKFSSLIKFDLVGALLAIVFWIATSQAQSTALAGSCSQNIDLALKNSATKLPPGRLLLVVGGKNSAYTAANACAKRAGTQSLPI